MAYIIDKAEDQLVDELSRADRWIARDSAYAGMFDRIADTRAGHVEKGTTIKTPDWRKVASMPSTLLDVLKLMSPDGVHLNKKQFYAWLNRNPQYKSREADLAAMVGGF